MVNRGQMAEPMRGKVLIHLTKEDIVTTRWGVGWEDFIIDSPCGIAIELKCDAAEELANDLRALLDDPTLNRPNDGR